LTSIIRSHSSSLVSTSDRRSSPKLSPEIPALLISVSIPPKRSSVDSTTRSTASASRTSAGATSVSPSAASATALEVVFAAGHEDDVRPEFREVQRHRASESLLAPVTMIVSSVRVAME